MKIKIIFKQSTGAIFGTSPDIDISEDTLDEVHEFCSNEWEEVAECGCYEGELILWFDEEQNREDFQNYVDEIVQSFPVSIPDFSTWNKE